MSHHASWMCPSLRGRMTQLTAAGTCRLSGCAPPCFKFLYGSCGPLDEAPCACLSLGLCQLLSPSSCPLQPWGPSQPSPPCSCNFPSLQCLPLPSLSDRAIYSSGPQLYLFLLTGNLHPSPVPCLCPMLVVSSEEGFSELQKAFWVL